MYIGVPCTPFPSSSLVLSLSLSWSFVSREQHAVSDWAFFGLPASGGCARFWLLGPSLLLWVMRALPSRAQRKTAPQSAGSCRGGCRKLADREHQELLPVLPTPACHLPPDPQPPLPSQLTVPLRQDCEAEEMVLLIKCVPHKCEGLSP